jgi:hypothetical protein
MTFKGSAGLILFIHWRSWDKWISSTSIERDRSNLTDSEIIVEEDVGLGHVFRNCLRRRT